MLRGMNLDGARAIKATSSTDGFTVEGLDVLFQREVYGDHVMMMTQFVELLYNRMHSLHIRGAFRGYGFLFEMPEDDGIRWLRKACLDLRRFHERMPEEFPPDGIEASFDRLRKWRKSKRPNP